MKQFYKQALLFWFGLLFLALINATIRETTYKPFLAPMIGIWAHQISSVTGISLFFGGIYFFLKNTKEKYTRRDLKIVGLMWIAMTLIFETGMNYYVRKLTLMQVLETYYFWRGDTWLFVLLSLGISPWIANSMLKKKSTVAK